MRSRKRIFKRDCNNLLMEINEVSLEAKLWKRIKFQNGKSMRTKV